MNSSLARLIAVPGVPLLILGCSPSAPGEATAPLPKSERPRLVLLYAPCTVSPSFLAPYAPSEAATTPHLSAFAEDAAVFDSHRTEAGLSGIAYASLLSGVQATEHGILTHPNPLPDSLYLIPEAFRDAGYETFAWAAHTMASPSLHYTQGVPPENTFERILGPGRKRFIELLEQLAADPDYRAFVFSNFTVTHGPYTTSTLERFCEQLTGACGVFNELSEAEIDAYLGAYIELYASLRYNFPHARSELAAQHLELETLAEILEVLYRANVHYLDEIFGGVLRKIEKAGLSDEALIVFTADHGETLYDPRAPFQWSHGHSLQAEVLTIPLLVRGPGVVPQRISRVTRSIDIHPTILGLAGIAPAPVGEAGRSPDNLVGQDLTSMLAGGPELPPRTAFSHTGKLPMSNLQMNEEEIGLLKRLYPTDDMEHTWVAARRGARTWKLIPRHQGWGIETLEVRGVADEMVTRFYSMPEAVRGRFGFGWKDRDTREVRAILRGLVAYKESLIAADDSAGLRERGQEILTDEERIEKLKSLGYVH